MSSLCFVSIGNSFLICNQSFCRWKQDIKGDWSSYGIARWGTRGSAHGPVRGEQCSTHAWHLRRMFSFLRLVFVSTRVLPRLLFIKKAISSLAFPFVVGTHLFFSSLSYSFILAFCWCVELTWCYSSKKHGVRPCCSEQRRILGRVVDTGGHGHVIVILVAELPSHNQTSPPPLLPPRDTSCSGACVGHMTAAFAPERCCCWTIWRSLFPGNL